jgi:hypothetical protein
MSDVFGPASLAAGQTLSSFTTFLPRLTEVRKASIDDPGMAGDVRLGEVAACAISIGVGVIASSLSRSPVPMYAAAFMAVILICVYESALRGTNLFEPVVKDA